MGYEWLKEVLRVQETVSNKRKGEVLLSAATASTGSYYAKVI
jgi:hypothetical protein